MAAVDILCLTLNLPLSYWDVHNLTWEFDEITCKIFVFTKETMVSVTVFTIISLSIERFLVSKAFKKINELCKVKTLPTTWLLLMTWTSALVTSSPTYFSAVVDSRCLYCSPKHKDFLRNIWSFQLLMNCLLPAVVMAFLNTKTFLSLRETVRMMPGEIKNTIVAKNRIRAANVVSILALVFIISYLPNFILRALVAWSILDAEDVFLLSFFSFCLFFCNTIFNPISVFIMSSQFQSCAITYLPFANTNTIDNNRRPYNRKYRR